MQNQKFGIKKAFRRRAAAKLTGIFMAAACVLNSTQAYALAPPPIPEETVIDNALKNNNRACVQTLDEAAVRELGYKSLSSVKTATLFTYFLKKNGNTQSAAALQDILRASEDTGVDFELLMVEAMLESNLGRYDRPIAVPSGAARGAFQFMPQTWLNLFNWFGGKIQNGKYQNLIDQMDYDPQSHQASVSDDAVKQQILDLRSNPYVAAYIKAMQIKNEDGPVLRAILGREPNKTDYYVAHVFGLPRAQTFYHHMNNNPNSAAARIMSKEARYNRYLFYNNGKQMSFKQVYDRFTRLIDIREDLVRNAMIDALNDTTCVAVAPRQISVPKIMLA